MQVLMKIIKYIIVLSLLLNLFSAQAQTGSFEKSWHSKTNLKLSLYHFGGYASERAIIYIEQHLAYRIHPKFSVGGGFGINSYPFLLAFPIFVEGQYHFKIKSRASYIYQSLGRNIKITDVFFKSNRYVGSLGTKLKLSKKLSLAPELGYSLIWDKYGGGDLSLFVGIGIGY